MRVVSAIPEVVEAYTVTGEADGILRVRAADTGHFEKVLGIIRNHRASRVPDHLWFSPDSETGSDNGAGCAASMRHSAVFPCPDEHPRRAEGCVRFCRVRLKQ